MTILISALTAAPRHEIIITLIPQLRVIAFAPAAVRSTMNDFNRKVEDASARVSKTVAEAAERLEKEIPEFIKYLNDEVVPAVRQHSTKALRVASVKLTELADYMEKQKGTGK
ncbi:MAG: hypothetical protein ABSA78_12790 [Candidatus Sulfotelmatobacter sp.]